MWEVKERNERLATRPVLWENKQRWALRKRKDAKGNSDKKPEAEVQAVVGDCGG